MQYNDDWDKMNSKPDESYFINMQKIYVWTTKRIAVQ